MSTNRQGGRSEVHYTFSYYHERKVSLELEISLEYLVHGSELKLDSL